MPELSPSVSFPGSDDLIEVHHVSVNSALNDKAPFTPETPLSVEMGHNVYQETHSIPTTTKEAAEETLSSEPVKKPIKVELTTTVEELVQKVEERLAAGKSEELRSDAYTTLTATSEGLTTLMKWIWTSKGNVILENADKENLKGRLEIARKEALKRISEDLKTHYGSATVSQEALFFIRSSLSSMKELVALFNKEGNNIQFASPEHEEMFKQAAEELKMTLVIPNPKEKPSSLSSTLVVRKHEWRKLMKDEANPITCKRSEDYGDRSTLIFFEKPQDREAFEEKLAALRAEAEKPNVTPQEQTEIYDKPALDEASEIILEAESPSSVLAFIEKELQTKNEYTVSDDDYKILTSSDEGVIAFLLTSRKYPKKILVNDAQQKDIKERMGKISQTIMDHVRERFETTSESEPITISTEELQVIHISKKQLQNLAELLNRDPERVHFASAADEKDFRGLAAKFSIALPEVVTVAPKKEPETPTEEGTTALYAVYKTLKDGEKVELTREDYTWILCAQNGLEKITHLRQRYSKTLLLSDTIETDLKARILNAALDALGAIRERLKTKRPATVSELEFVLIKSSSGTLNGLVELFVKHPGAIQIESKTDSERFQIFLDQKIGNRALQSTVSAKPKEEPPKVAHQHVANDGSTEVRANGKHFITPTTILDASEIREIIHAGYKVRISAAQCEHFLISPSDDFIRMIDDYINSKKRNNPVLVFEDSASEGKLYDALEEYDNADTVVPKETSLYEKDYLYPSCYSPL